MKNRLLVIDGILQDIAGFPSVTLSIIQSHVPDNVLVVLDEDIHKMSLFTDFSQFNSYSVISSTLDYTRVELEKYHLLIEHALSNEGVETIDDVLSIIKRFYCHSKLISNCTPLDQITIIDSDHKVVRCYNSNDNSTTSCAPVEPTPPKNRFDDLFN